MHSYLAIYLFMSESLLQALHHPLPRTNSKSPTGILQSIDPVNASHRISIDHPLPSLTRYYQTICTDCDTRNYCSPQYRTVFLLAHTTVVLPGSAKTPCKQTDIAELRYQRRKLATQASSTVQKRPSFHPPGNK